MHMAWYDEVNRCTWRDAGVMVRASLAPTRCSNPVYHSVYDLIKVNKCTYPDVLEMSAKNK